MTGEASKDKECDTVDSLFDGRCDGDFESRFRGPAQWQIGFEAFYLYIIIVFSLICLWQNLSCVSIIQNPTFFNDNKTPLYTHCNVGKAPLIIISAFFWSGMAGGSVFSLKWLYHSVAKNRWHKDRFFWRVSVPLMGGVLGVFVTFIFARTLGTSFDSEALQFKNLLPACGLSFLVGVFADGVLATLERLARSIFGTLESFNNSE